MLTVSMQNNWLHANEKKKNSAYTFQNFSQFIFMIRTHGATSGILYPVMSCFYQFIIDRYYYSYYGRTITQIPYNHKYRTAQRKIVGVQRPDSRNFKKI